MITPLTSASPLSAELAAVRGELARVDAKCGTLTGLAGAALAFLVTQSHGPLLVRAPLVIAGLLLASAVLVLLAVLRPRLGGTGFRRYHAMSPGGIRSLFATPPRADDIEPQELKVISAIVDRKYRYLRIAVHLMGLAVVFIAAALLAGVVA